MQILKDQDHSLIYISLISFIMKFYLHFRVNFLYSKVIFH